MRAYITHNFRILLKGTLAFHSSMAALFSASVNPFAPARRFTVDQLQKILPSKVMKRS